jgi:hypothetical protein
MTLSQEILELLRRASTEPVQLSHVNTTYTFVSGVSIGGRMKQADAQLYALLRNNAKKLAEALSVFET